MNKHKTFGYYLLELIKIICFFAALAWLISCSNRKQKVINAIHACEDSIRQYQLLALSLGIKKDSVTTAYHSTYPPTLFYYNKQGDEKRKRWKAEEAAAYKKYIAHKAAIYAQQIVLRARVKQLEKSIDSLKLELYK